MSTWHEGLCRGSGVDIHYRRTGGFKPSLVLLHGLTGAGSCWSSLARALEADYDVVMPDARGHGESSTPSHGYRYDDYANDVLELIQGLQLTSPVLLGHSMGGLTAALVASELRQALCGLILADPTFLSPERQIEVHESDVAEQHRRVLRLTKVEALAEAQSRHPHREAELVSLVVEARMKSRINAFEVLVPPNPDYRELVTNIPIPILLVIADGGVVTPEAAREIQQLNHRVRLHKIDNSGHGIHYDQPEQFEAAVRPFLKSITS